MNSLTSYFCFILTEKTIHEENKSPWKTEQYVCSLTLPQLQIRQHLKHIPRAVDIWRHRPVWFLVKVWVQQKCRIQARCLILLPVIHLLNRGNSLAFSLNCLLLYIVEERSCLTTTVHSTLLTGLSGTFRFTEDVTLLPSSQEQVLVQHTPCLRNLLPCSFANPIPCLLF